MTYAAAGSERLHAIWIRTRARARDNAPLIRIDPLP
jgi:hypothetical protein